MRNSRAMCLLERFIFDFKGIQTLSSVASLVLTFWEKVKGIAVVTVPSRYSL